MGDNSFLVADNAPVPYRKAKRAQSTTDDESWVQAEASNTLNNFDLGDTRTTHAVVEPIPIQDGREIEKRQNGLGVARQGDPAYTVDTTGAQSVAQPIAIQGTIIGRGENAGPQGVGATEGGPMFTLTKTDIHGVAQPLAFDGYNQTLSETSQTIRADKSDGDHVGMVVQPVEPSIISPTVTTCKGSRGGCSSEAIDEITAVHNAQPPTMAVRRLTPVECERLQGFPDNWSRIPWKGKPEEDCPDGPRYKACGNSMAVPVMRWIGKRIAEVDAKLSQTK
jgi:site-specific DNA-cytosine methylase